MGNLQKTGSSIRTQEKPPEIKRPLTAFLAGKSNSKTVNFQKDKRKEKENEKKTRKRKTEKKRTKRKE